MESISNPKRAGSASGYYFRYYSDHAQGQAFWFGRGVSFLGLSTPVLEHEFNNLLEGFSPDGNQKLVQNAGSEKRQGFWDVTFSVPKALSVLYAVAPSLREEIREAGELALRQTLAELETVVGLSRMGKEGKRIVPAALSFAVFFHETSRAEDPQLHWHCILANVGVREDGSTGALYTRILFEQKMAGGELFREHLAAELTRRFGLEIQTEPTGFGIRGIPEKLCETLSKRRHEIISYLEKHRQQGGAAAKVAAIKTRGTKRHSDIEQLTRLWSEAGRVHGFGSEQVDFLLGKGRERLEEKSPSSQPKLEEQTGRNKRERTGTQDRSSSKSNENSKTENQSKNKQRWNWRFRFTRDSEARKKAKEARQALKNFKQELRGATDRIFAENQTRPRITRIAYALARKHGVNRDAVPRAVDALKLPVHRRLYRIEWAPLFPKAPKWTGIKNLRVKKIVLRNRRRRWGKIKKRTRILPFKGGKLSLVVQERSLFPGAPSWNPARKLIVPAIRLKREKLKLPEARRQEQSQTIHR